MNTSEEQPYDIALIICLIVLFSIVLTRVAYTQSADIYSIHILPFARTDTLISDVHCYATNDTAFSLVILTLIRLKKLDQYYVNYSISQKRVFGRLVSSLSPALSNYVVFDDF